MDKTPITEEMHLEKEWFEQAEKIKTVEQLSDFVKRLLEGYLHDYGTVCHAIGACAVAAAWLGAHVEEITGFQAGFVMWDFIKNWVKQGNKCGLKLVDYDDFLYPQYGYRYDKTISQTTWNRIQEEAKRNLESANGCDAVRKHWQSIADGNVPFGYSVADD